MLTSGSSCCAARSKDSELRSAPLSPSRRNRCQNKRIGMYMKSLQPKLAYLKKHCSRLGITQSSIVRRRWRPTSGSTASCMVWHIESSQNNISKGKGTSTRACPGAFAHSKGHRANNSVMTRQPGVQVGHGKRVQWHTCLNVYI